MHQPHCASRSAPSDTGRSRLKRAWLHEHAQLITIPIPVAVFQLARSFCGCPLFFGTRTYPVIYLLIIAVSKATVVHSVVSLIVPAATMPVTKLPPILDFHTCSDLTQTDILDTLFEPSPAIHATLLPVIRTAEYSSWPDLIDACQIRLLALATASPGTLHPTLQSVLGSHPRLGEKKIDSAQSVAEQANLQKNSDPAQEQELAKLNREYEEKFPGLRYVVFVNGRGRPEIMEDMRERIAKSDVTKEVDSALQVRRGP